jgi:hypothetical protein
MIKFDRIDRQRYQSSICAGETSIVYMFGRAVPDGA